jgi:hypothetical protein
MKKRTNKPYLDRLVNILFKIKDFPQLDRYFSKILGREIKYSWKIFRYIATFAQEGEYWEWINDDQLAYYGKSRVPTFSIFCTCMLHECAHGMCYFLAKPDRSYRYPKKIDEEQVYHEVSEMVCKKINVKFAKELAELAYQIHRTKAPEKVLELVARLPKWISVPEDLVKL